MPRREYKGNAIPTRLTATLNAGVTTHSINSASGWPTGGANGPFNITYDPGTATEEHATATTRTGTTISGITRGQDGTSDQTHTVGADGTVIHGWFGQDADDANRHIYVTTDDNHTQYMLTAGGRHDLTARHSAGSVVPTAVAGTAVVGAVAAEGTGTNAARATHAHAFPTGTPVDTGTANSAGSGGLFVHANHVHAIGVGSINAANKFAAGVVDNAAIGTAAVGSDELGAASVIAGKIAAGGVSATNQYADATITDAKFVSRLAKGFLARFTSSSSDSAHGPGGNTDMTVTVALTAGRTYWIHLHSQVLFGSIVGAYAIELDHDTATVGRFWRGDLGSSETIFCDSWIEYTPGSSDASAVLTVQNGTSSAGNMTAQGGAANIRTLSVYDAGTV